ncbi:SRPBCC family protein OS=Streptomyces fumanus OX=67302 GN=GCM10018772_01090 PE=4 SV=1 [Streptomyces fumanus]
MSADFAAIASWHPAITDSGPGPGPATRQLRTSDGHSITEHLLVNDSEARIQEYVLVSHPFPVTDYRARIEVRPTGTQRCEVHWSASFRPTAGDGGAERAMFENEIFRPGLDALAEGTALD